jgi:predicted O-methyltransferase YrrM
MIRIVALILATSLMTMKSSASSKFSSPPSIANVKRHEEMINQLLGMEDVVSIKAKQHELAASEIPQKLQAHANRFSLKPSPEELALQKEVEQLQFAGMAGAPDEANLLCLFIEILDAKKIVEVGVFRGTTTLAMARCLDGLNKKNSSCNRRVIGLDVSSDYAAIGQKHWKLAGVDKLIDFRVGDAKLSLESLLNEDEYGENSVDLCFIDADKTSYDDYYEKCVRLTKNGGLVVIDNTIWGGMVAIPDEILHELASREPNYSAGDTSDEARVVRRAKDTLAIKRLTEKIHSDDRIERVSFLTIADGVTICRKK